MAAGNTIAAMPAFDDDDRPGYLIDYVKAWAEKQGIKTKNRYYELFEEDFFLIDDIPDFVEEILELAGVFKKEGK